MSRRDDAPAGPGQKFESSKQIKIVPTFDEMGLKEDLLRGIYAYGFEKPSAIQQRAITPILEGRDVIAQSQSGTGKTTIFCIGVLQSISTRSRETQALVLSPTRELAEQSRNVMLAFGDYMNVSAHACIGGKSVGDDMRTLQSGVHVVSGKYMDSVQMFLLRLWVRMCYVDAIMFVLVFARACVWVGVVVLCA